MLGILYWLFAGGVCAINKYKENSYNDWARDEAIRKQNRGDNPAGVYTDFNGRTRDIKTGASRFIHQDKYGDAWVEDLHGHKFRNLTAERVDQEWKNNLQIEENRGRIATLYTRWDKRSSRIRGEDSFDVITGRVYKDVKTEELYIARYITWDAKTNEKPKIPVYPEEIDRLGAAFYMRVSDGTLACLRDQWEKETHYGSSLASIEQAETFMKHFNEEQKQGGWLKESCAWKKGTRRDFYLDYENYHSYLK